MQYAIQRDKVFVIEVNPRASRTVPYVSKATGIPLAKIAARLMTGRKLREFLPENIERAADLDTGSFYFVKSPVFPWGKFPGRRHRAWAGDEVHRRSDGRGRQLRRGLCQSASSPPDRCCPPQERSSSAATIATSPSCAELRAPLRRTRLQHWWRRTARPTCSRMPGLHVERVYKVKEGRPNVVDLIKGERIQLIINTPHGVGAMVRREGDSPRRRHGTHSDDHHALRRPRCLRRHRRTATRRLKVYALQHLHAERVAAAR